MTNTNTFDLELAETELEHVVGGFNSTANGVHFQQVTLRVQDAPSEKHWFNGG